MHVTFSVTKLLNKIAHPTADMEIVVDPGNDKIGWQNCFGQILWYFDINSKYSKCYEYFQFQIMKCHVTKTWMSISLIILFSDTSCVSILTVSVTTFTNTV